MNVLIRMAIVLLALSPGLRINGQVVYDAADPNGTAMSYPRVRLVHSSDSSLLGTTANLREFDPFLLYQLGRDLVHRQYTFAEGLYGRSGELTVPLYVQGQSKADDSVVPARFARDHAASCDSCHSMPAREPGSGQTIASTGPMGRNTPHFFGAGLVEMICEQIRAEILRAYDKNGNAQIDREEVAQSRPVRIAPYPGMPAVDYGDLSPGSDGVPRLNPLFRVWYVDASGKVLPDALSLKDPRVAAFNFAAQPFGWGRGLRVHRTGEATSEGAEASTLRSIFTLAADVHMGLQADDPSQRSGNPGANQFVGGKASVSLSGAQQYDFGTATDFGHSRNAAGMSLDDPDGDGNIAELTEGDVDAAEFYMLHAPAPAVRATARSEQGRSVLRQAGCERCHVENWYIRGAEPRTGWTGDRRLFHLSTRSRRGADGTSELTGRLVRSWQRLRSGEYVPQGKAFAVERIYTDFKQWDIGPEFYERRYDGSVQRQHRTSPLWGAGSTAPYGHSGQFQTLDAVISAHAGAAKSESAAYRGLSADRRQLLIEYLESLVLYPTDEIAADIDGDGKISRDFAVASQQVGYERFDARFLFNHPPQYHRFFWAQNPEGREVPVAVIENPAEAFGLDLPYRHDSRGDGFPDFLAGSKSGGAHR